MGFKGQVTGHCLKKILSAKDIRDIYRSALRVLSEVGVKCDHKKAVDVLGQKGRLRYEAGRLHLDPRTLDEFFEDRKKRIAVKKPDNAFRLGGAWHSWELCDPVRNRPRPATAEESVQMAKLSEALGANGGPIPVAPGGTEPRLHTLTCEKIALLHTRTLGGLLTATDRNEIRILADMHKAAGRKYRLGLEGFITPLRLNSEIFNAYFEWCDDPDVEMAVMPTIPMAGASAPLVFPANLVLALAEGIALDYFSHTLSGGKLQGFSLRLEPFDMKHSNIVFGSPEWCLFKQATVELYEGLTGRKPGGSFRTNGKVVDGQTLIERTASFMWQATLGIRRFGAVGQLCVDEIYSPVQAILDREILRYGDRVFRGITPECWDRSRDPIQVVREGVRENGFLAHETTLGIFRSMYDFDRLASSCNLSAWRTAGSPGLEARAWEEAQALIRKHDFELDAARRRDVEKLFDRGQKLLSSTRPARSSIA